MCVCVWLHTHLCHYVILFEKKSVFLRGRKTQAIGQVGRHASAVYVCILEKDFPLSLETPDLERNASSIENVWNEFGGSS